MNPLKNDKVKLLGTLGGLFAVATLGIQVIRSERVSLFISSLTNKGAGN